MDNHNHNDEDFDLEILAESESYAVLRGADDAGEAIYNIELGPVTLHLLEDEWEELVALIREAAS